MKTKNASFLAIAASLCLSATAPAAITTSGNFQTGTPTFTIDSPFTLKITTSGDVQALALAGWVTADGSPDYAYAASAGQLVSYQINGGTIQTVEAYYLADNNVVGAPGTPAANDGAFGFISTIAVTAGQTFTFLPGTFVFNPAKNFNPPPTVFNGEAYLVGSRGSLSVPTSVNAVPEPSTWAMLLGGAGVLALVRKRRKGFVGF